MWFNNIWDVTKNLSITLIFFFRSMTNLFQTVDGKITLKTQYKFYQKSTNCYLKFVKFSHFYLISVLLLLIFQKYTDLFEFLIKFQSLLRLSKVIELILLNESCMRMLSWWFFLCFFLVGKSFILSTSFF